MVNVAQARVWPPIYAAVGAEGYSFVAFGVEDVLGSAMIATTAEINAVTVNVIVENKAGRIIFYTVEVPTLR